MKALLLYPRFPKTFWSYDKFMKIAGLKAFIPPLGIITVAALLPADWEIRFYDRNVNQETDADWEWCDIVILLPVFALKILGGEEITDVLIGLPWLENRRLIVDRKVGLLTLGYD